MFLISVFLMLMNFGVWFHQKEYRFQHIAVGKSVTANVLNNYKKSSKKDPVKAHLCRRYSFFWQNKIRLLLITGDEAAIEQLVPDRLSTAQLQALQQTSPPPEPGISKTQQLLAQLLHLKPDWAVSYGDRLVQQALTLWPEEAKPLAQQWHKQISVAGLAESELNGWHQGMTQLQQLTNRLNALDEQKGKYMTVSELKSAVFAMSQSFSHTVPLEEQLRLLSILPAGQPVSAAQLNQAEQHLQQLIASYALLKHQKE